MMNVGMDTSRGNVTRDTVRAKAPLRYNCVVSNEPPWGAPHLSNRAMAAVEQRFVQILGRAAVEQCLDEAGIPRDWFADATAWTSFESADAFARALARRAAGDAAPPGSHPVWEHWREAMRLHLATQEIGTLRFIGRAVVGAPGLYRRAPELYGRIDRVARLDVKRAGWLQYDFVVPAFDGDGPWACRMRAGFLEALPAASGLGHARVTHRACVHRGDERCEYTVQVPNAAWMVAMGATLALALGGLTYVAAGVPVGLATAGLAVAALAEYRRIADQRDRAEEITQLRAAVQGGEARYEQLWEERQSLRRALRSARKMSTFLAADVADRLAADVDPVTDTGISVSEAAVLFADIVGFTARCERDAPDRVIHDLNTWYVHVDRVIETYGGLIDKRLGDGMMVVFPSRGDSTEEFHKRVVACARGMLKALNRCNEVLVARGSEPLAIRIGVASGELGRGHVGSSIKGERTVIGDVVNTASRLEALATPGHVLLPRDMLPPGLAAEARSLHLKGKAAAVEVVEIGA